MREATNGSGHAGALKELETHARNLSEAPGAVREGIAHLDEVIADLQGAVEHVTEEGEAEVARIAEDGRLARLDAERKVEELEKTARGLEAKLGRARTTVTAATEHPQEEVVVEGEQTRLIPSKSLRGRR